MHIWDFQSPWGRDQQDSKSRTWHPRPVSSDLSLKHCPYPSLGLSVSKLRLTSQSFCLSSKADIEIFYSSASVEHCNLSGSGGVGGGRGGGGSGGGRGGGSGGGSGGGGGRGDGRRRMKRRRGGGDSTYPELYTALAVLVSFYKNEVYKKDRLEILKIKKKSKKVVRLTHHTVREIERLHCPRFKVHQVETSSEKNPCM